MTAIRPSVALVHDYLTQRGGAERVVLAMHRAFPDAPLYTSLYDPAATYPQFALVDVRTSPVDQVRSLRHSHRLALPLFAPAFSAMRVDADVVICSSSGWAHGVRTRGRKIVYCHAPARWLYQADDYLRGTNVVARTGLRGVRPLLMRWDRRAAQSADGYLVNSHHTRSLVRAAYGIDAEVLHPPYGVDTEGSRQPVPSMAPGYFLCVSRMLPYKHVDAVVSAFDQLPSDRLVVVGSGPEERKIRALAGRNVTLLSALPDAVMRWLYVNARALIAASYEDFGLTPIEAARFGTPTVALRFGGYLDTVVDGATGAFFDSPTPNAIATAIRRVSDTRFDAQRLTRHAQKFSEERFRGRLRELVATDGTGASP